MYNRSRDLHLLPLNWIPIMPRDMSLSDRSMKNVPFLKFMHRFIPSDRLRYIFPVTQKIKFGKLIFHSIQHIAHLSLKREQETEKRGGFVKVWKKLFVYFMLYKCAELFVFVSDFGSVPTNDMQTLPSVFIPLSWNMRNVLNRMKNQFSIFIFRVIVKINRKLGWFEYKKKLSFQHIPHHP